MPDPYARIAFDQPGMCPICWTRHPDGACKTIRLPSVLEQAQRAILDPRNCEPPEVKVNGFPDVAPLFGANGGDLVFQEAALRAIEDAKEQYMIASNQLAKRSKSRKLGPDGQPRPKKAKLVHNPSLQASPSTTLVTPSTPGHSDLSSVFSTASTSHTVPSLMVQSGPAPFPMDVDPFIISSVGRVPRPIETPPSRVSTKVSVPSVLPQVTDSARGPMDAFLKGSSSKQATTSSGKFSQTLE